MKKKKSTGSIILGILLAIVVWFLKEKGYLTDGSAASGKSESTETILKEDAPLDGFTIPKTNGAGMELLANCSLIPARNNDGDSFHIRHAKGENEFRLYFADAPESAYRTYQGGDDNGQRISEQGAYFGGLDRTQTTEVGTAAKDFVKKLLSQGPFKILTKWEDVYDPGRQYCLVIVPYKGREVYLHELLVAKGLARIHTRGADLPQGRSWKAQKEFLKTLEKTAKMQKTGAWGL